MFLQKITIFVVLLFFKLNYIIINFFDHKFSHEAIVESMEIMNILTYSWKLNIGFDILFRLIFQHEFRLWCFQ